VSIPKPLEFAHGDLYDLEKELSINIGRLEGATEMFVQDPALKERLNKLAGDLNKAFQIIESGNTELNDIVSTFKGASVMEELRFGSEEEALQYLADKTGSKIKIAESAFDRAQRRWDNMTPEEGPEFDNFFGDESNQDYNAVKQAKEATLRKLKSVGIDHLNIELDVADDLTDYKSGRYRHFEAEGLMTVTIRFVGDVEEANERMGSSKLEGDPKDGERIFNFLLGSLNADYEEWEFHDSNDEFAEWSIYFKYYDSSM